MYSSEFTPTDDEDSHLINPKARTTPLSSYLHLPTQLLLILLLEFLNTFCSYGLRVVIFNYITNEFSLSDTLAGQILGIKSLIDIAAGLAGSLLVDVWGIKRVALLALSIASVGRAILGLGRTAETLKLAMWVLSPWGDAMLSVGLYRVALKKLSTPRTRVGVFCIGYAVQNFAGWVVSLVVDGFRRGNDVTVEMMGGVFTPVRQFIIVTWLIVLAMLTIAYIFLEDLTVIDPEDPDHDIQFNNNDPSGPIKSNGTSNNSYSALATNNEIAIRPISTMIQREKWKRWFPQQYESIKSHSTYKMVRSMNSHCSDARPSSSFQGIVHVWNRLISILKIRNSWRVILFSFASVAVALQWTASDIVLPSFLERQFGEGLPIYTIQSIHMVGCMILPPFVASKTSAWDDFQVIMPGLWIMATSPIMLALSPTVMGACAWQVFMTLGQVLWSPRQDAWTASLAPNGMEGLFFAVASSRALLVPLGDYAMGRMNDKYNGNCPQCRDSYGHFCNRKSVVGDILSCASVQELCEMSLETQLISCPSTCNECPVWQSTDPSTFWYILLLISMSSPLLVWIFSPFLRCNKHQK